MHTKRQKTGIGIAIGTRQIHALPLRYHSWMPFHLHFPQLPVTPLQDCTDHQRKIGAMCWNLPLVQAGLADGTLKLNLTPGAAQRAALELQWTEIEMLSYFYSLGKHRYCDSEWCLPTKSSSKLTGFAADSYSMGFDRIKGEENQKREPYVYSKFTVVGSVSVLVFSLHLSTIA